jgi:hypothetical protein
MQQYSDPAMLGNPESAPFTSGIAAGTHKRDYPSWEGK